MTLQSGVRKARAEAGNGLHELVDFVLDEWHTGAVLVKAASALPLLEVLIAIGPPWPERSYALGTAIVAQILLYLVTFTYFRTIRHRKVRTLLYLATALWVLVTAGYVTSMAFFSFDAPGQRIVGGWELLPAVRSIKEPGESQQMLLYLAGYDEWAVWTEFSIVTMRLLVFTQWLVSYISVSVALAATVRLGQLQRRYKRPDSAGGSRKGARREMKKGVHHRS